jgi:hypothetical protein
MMGAGFKAVGGKRHANSARHGLLSLTTPHHLPIAPQSLSITRFLLQALVNNA